MNRKRLGSYLVSLCLVSLAFTALEVQAVTTVQADKKKQS